MLLVYEPTDPPVTDGAHYFTLDELRLEQDVPATYPDSSVEPNRELAEQVLEDACGVAFLPRRRTEQATIDATGRARLAMPLCRELEGITENDIAWTVERVAEITVDTAGLLIGVRWRPGLQVSVTYTHGYETPPARIRRAAMIATRIWTTRGPVDDRATQVAADGATVNLATPGLLGSVTGIPEVDATISLYRWPELVG